MRQSGTPTVVAILIADDERALLLHRELAAAGLRPVRADPASLHDEAALRTMVVEHEPRVLLYDLEPPLDAHLAFFRLLHDPLLGGRRVVVLTSIPSVVRPERRRLGISRVIGLPATVAEIVAVLRRVACTSGARVDARQRAADQVGRTEDDHARIVRRPRADLSRASGTGPGGVGRRHASPTLPPE